MKYLRGYWGFKTLPYVNLIDSAQRSILAEYLYLGPAIMQAADKSPVVTGKKQR